jgi:hypothetical protein
VTALLQHARFSKALGTSLSGGDVEKLLVAITAHKHRAILMTAHGAGLRIGEVSPPVWSGAGISGIAGAQGPVR